MKFKVVWTIIVHLAILRIGVHGQEYVRSLEQLTFEETVDYYPDWSPDGTRIAFESNRDGNWEIYVMNHDGSDVQRLTDDPGNDLMPAWSPDGSLLAFQTDRDGNWEIYLMSADGSNPIRVTNNDWKDSEPVWKP